MCAVHSCLCIANAMSPFLQASLTLIRQIVPVLTCRPSKRKPYCSLTNLSTLESFLSNLNPDSLYLCGILCEYPSF